MTVSTFCWGIWSKKANSMADHCPKCFGFETTHGTDYTVVQVCVCVEVSKAEFIPSSSEAVHVPECEPLLKT